MDLITFLRARLDEDEQTARRIKATRHGALIVAPGDGESPSVFEVRSDRLLAEVEAKREMVQWARRMDPAPGMGGIIAGEARKILKWLALPYADHVDYREGWKP